MAANETGTLAKLVGDHEKEILPEWLALQKKAGALATGRIKESELATQCTNFLHLLRDGLAKGGMSATHAGYGPARDMLGIFSGTDVVVAENLLNAPFKSTSSGTDRTWLISRSSSSAATCNSAVEAPCPSSANPM